MKTKKILKRLSKILTAFEKIASFDLKKHEESDFGNGRKGRLSSILAESLATLLPEIM